MEWVPDVFKAQSDRFDRCLIVEGHRIWIPQAILSVHSNKFHRLFRENPEGEIPLAKSTKLAEFMEVLECLVPCPTLKTVNEHNLDAVLRLAEEYDFPELRSQCQKFVDDSIAREMGASPARGRGRGSLSSFLGGGAGSGTSGCPRDGAVSAWDQQKAKEAALRAVSLCPDNRPPRGPFAHLYDKPIPKDLQLGLAQASTGVGAVGSPGGGILSRPAPMAMGSWRPDTPRYSAPETSRYSTVAARPAHLVLAPNGAPSKAYPLHVHTHFGSYGPGHGQFNSPHGFCLSPSDDRCVVADTNNHRIQVFSPEGTFLFEFGVPGRDDGNLWYPRKVAVNSARKDEFIICDRGSERSRMQIFDKNGIFLRKIPIRYVDIVAGLTVNANGEIVVVDSVSPSIFIINPDSGDLARWFDCSHYMKEPSDIAAYSNELFVCDFKGHCVAVFDGIKGDFCRRIGCESITTFPNGIDISRDGDVIVADSHGNRLHLSVFKWTGELEAEYDCPHLKVSRCCGLRITSEGNLITLAKNNHNVMVMEAVTIPELPPSPTPMWTYNLDPVLESPVPPPPNRYNDYPTPPNS